MRARKRDRNEPQIVDALRQAGCLVYRELPCDLLVYCPRPVLSHWKLIEVKDESVKRPRADQKRQNEFLALTDTPTVRTVEEALTELGSGK